MAKKQIIEQINQVWQNFQGLQVEKTIESTQTLTSWNNLTPDDYKDSLNDLKRTLEDSFTQNIWENYPWNILQSVQSSLNSVYQQTNQFINSPQQSTFNNSFQQIESLRTSFHSWGIYSYIQFGQNIENKIQLIDTEYQNIITKSGEIEDLKNSVQNLIEPAVAGSLSKSFSDRQLKLEKNRKVWLNISIGGAIASAIATVLVVLKLIDVLTFSIPAEATQEQINTILNRQPSNMGIQLLRIAILFPFYSLFVYAFNQYKRERNLEEEYAHRSAVSTSLPNYGDLAGNQSVKDQIISSATNVVFTSPIEKNKGKNKESSNNLTDIKGLIESIGKVIKTKEE